MVVIVSSEESEKQLHSGCVLKESTGLPDSLDMEVWKRKDPEWLARHVLGQLNGEKELVKLAWAGKFYFGHVKFLETC